jgi:hypothetical protein
MPVFQMVYTKHPDFVLVVCDNTAGRGASVVYNDRRKIDGAFLDRFFHLYWPIDENMERSIALSINPDSKPWIDWVQKARPWVSEHYPQLLMSPRVTYRFAKTLLHAEVFTSDEILDGCLFKGIDAETRNKVLSQYPCPKVN